jgi:hypothetical protein
LQVTLVLLVLDLYRLAEHATGGAESWLHVYTAAALMPVMVLLGAMYRFGANELRGKEKYDIDCPQVFVGVVGFVGSCAVFGVVMAGILNPIDEQLCAPGANATAGDKCPITDPELKYDADAVQVLTWTWIGYPIVSFLSRAMLPAYSEPNESDVKKREEQNRWYARTSLFKDLSYAVLDVVAKGGLAIYACYRTTWV